MIKRYDMTCEYNRFACEDQVVPVEDETGRWVKYKDVEKAMTNPYPPMWKQCKYCHGSGELCRGAGKCDHDGSECTHDNHCGEYDGFICPHCHGNGKVPTYYSPEKLEQWYKDNGIGVKVLDSDPVWALTMPDSQWLQVRFLIAQEYMYKYPDMVILMAFSGVPAPPIDYEEE